MNGIVRFVAACAAVVCVHASFAGATYYVDCTKADDSGAGTSEATAKKYINSAIALCASSGDTVIVLPGDYKDDPTITVDGVATRVAITNKCVYLKSRDGKEKTRITGAYSTDSTKVADCGPGAVRCLAITGAGAVNSVVEGFTLYRGATELSCCGGGIYGSGISQKGYVVDCNIIDCRGNMNNQGAACAYVTAVRCLFSRTEAYHSGPSAYGAGKYVNCVFMGVGGLYYGFSGGAYLYNCTVLCSSFACLWWPGNSSYEIYNTLAVATKGLTSGSGKGSIYNSVSSGSGKFGLAQDSVTNELSTIYQVVSPMSGDFRLTSDSAARNVGRAEWLSEKLDSLGAPATVDFYKDYAGNAIPKTGTIHAGAVQAVATVSSSGKKGVISPTSASGGVTFNGCPRLSKTSWDKGWENLAAWFMNETYPCQVKLGWDKYDQTLLYYTDTFKRTWIPDAEGTAYITLPNENVVFYVDAAKTAAKTYYVDCTRADDSGDGLTEGTAKRTIQSAVTAAKDANAASLVLVKPGTYDEGGVAIGGLTSRVGFVSGSPATCVRSTGGRDVTFIKGADDPNGDANGLGNNAVRCVGFDACTNCYVQGFTLTGGRTANASGASDAMKQGGGVYSLDLSVTERAIADCTVTNNRAWRHGGMYCGAAFRSYFADNLRCDNTTGYGFAYWTSYFVSCLVRAEQPNTYVFNGNCFIYDSTVDWVGVPSSDAKNFFSPGTRYANSILYNCRQIQLSKPNDGLFLVGCDLYGSSFIDTYESDGSQVEAENKSYVTGAPLFANRRSLDYRPTNEYLKTASDAFTKSGNYYLMDRDIAGRPFLFTDGKILPGAFQALGKRRGMILYLR